jgi:hypothetical protein
MARYNSANASMTPSIFGSGGFVEREVERGFVCAYRAMKRDRLLDEIQPVRLDGLFGVLAR